MIAFVRDFVRRVQRGERRALLIAAGLGALGFLVGGPGGRAYLEAPCSPLSSPVVEDRRVHDRVAIVERVVADPVRRPPPPARPPGYRATSAALPHPVRGASPTPSVSLRGPPQA